MAKGEGSCPRNHSVPAADNDGMDPPVARRHQRRPTGAQSALWAHLRGRRLAGYRFRRHHPSGPFVLDFFCVERRLAIQLHRARGPNDRPDDRRSRFLAARGITVLRFASDQVFREIEAVLNVIVFALTSRGAP